LGELTLYLQKKIKADATMIPGIMLVSVWLIFSMLYYHTILPTSFHIKTPSFVIGIAVNNGLYLLNFLVLSGLIALIPGKLSEIKFTPVLAGILAVLAYGLTCATTHMFFGYRMILPYLPAIALYLISNSKSVKRHFLLKSSFIVFAHLFSTWWMLNVCIDPRLPFVQADFSPRHRTVGQYHNFMNLLEKGGKEIAEHLREHPLQRPAKVVTFAGGYLPWHLPDAGIYDVLISYRKNCAAGKDFFKRFAPASDFIHIIFPLHGSPESTLGHPLTHYNIISREKTILDDKVETVYVLRNKYPSEIQLPVYVNGPCKVNEN